MRKRQGFTLVELLVVMAIIAILAAIVVPNAARFIGRARVTRALAEVSGAETAITAMLTDAGRSSLSQLFGPGAVPVFAIKTNDPDVKVVNGSVIAGMGFAPLEWPTAISNVANFKKVMDMYSSVVYDLLRYGRDSLRVENNSPARFVINNNTLSKLGTSYMDLGNDPWGNAYNIFPGPWKVASDGGTRWPIIFRKFSIDTGTGTGLKRTVKDDGFALRNPERAQNPDLISTTFSSIVEDAATWPDKVGYPADTGKSMYIWSTGENLRSGQMVYSAIYNGQDPTSWYTGFDGAPQDGSDLGGGDDINNWDKDATWARFTN